MSEKEAGMEISGNTVLITGGATGIGFALAELFLKSGNKVIICGRREERLLEAQRVHPDLHIRVCDVSDENGRKSLFDWVKANFYDCNILINNAGIQRDIDLKKGLDEITSGENEIRINFEAPVYLSALFIPFLSQKANPAIINVSSGLAFMPVPITGMPVYAATKAAIHSYTVSLRLQLKEAGIKVFELIPPVIKSELNKAGREKRGMTTMGISAEEFAAFAMKGLENEEYEIRMQMPQRPDIQKPLPPLRDTSALL
jgi:uncharacterized oxidoreductase